MNALVKAALAITPATDVAGRVKVLDWERVSQDLDAQGCAMIEGLITPEACDALAELYPVSVDANLSAPSFRVSDPANPLELAGAVEVTSGILRIFLDGRQPQITPSIIDAIAVVMINQNPRRSLHNFSMKLRVSGSRVNQSFFLVLFCGPRASLQKVSVFRRDQRDVSARQGRPCMVPAIAKMNGSWHPLKCQIILPIDLHHSNKQEAKSEAKAQARPSPVPPEVGGTVVCHMTPCREVGRFCFRK